MAPFTMSVADAKKLISLLESAISGH
jgi:hypothetical protein